MVKTDLIKAIATKKETTQKDAAAFLEVFEEVIKETFAADKDEKIQLGKIGTFKVKHVAEKSGTVQLGSTKGEKWTKPAHDELVFKVSSAMRNI